MMNKTERELARELYADILRTEKELERDFKKINKNYKEMFIGLR